MLSSVSGDADRCLAVDCTTAVGTAFATGLLLGTGAGYVFYPGLQQVQGRFTHGRERWLRNPDWLLPSFGPLPWHTHLLWRWRAARRPVTLPALGQGGATTGVSRLLKANTTPPQPRGTGSPLFTLSKSRHTLLYHAPTRSPVWCGYYVTSASLRWARRQRRPARFAPDPSLPKAHRWGLAEMKAKGYDRGHLAPHAMVATTSTAAEEAALLSNVVLQHRAVNQGIWSTLERAVREYVREGRVRDTVLGPLLAPASPRWGRGRSSPIVAVSVGPLYKAHLSPSGSMPLIPWALFMCVLDTQADRSVSFIVPNHPTESDSFARLHRTVVRRSTLSKKVSPVVRSASPTPCTSASAVRSLLEPFIVPLATAELELAASLQRLCDHPSPNAEAGVVLGLEHWKRPTRQLSCGAEQPLVMFPYHQRPRLLKPFPASAQASCNATTAFCSTRRARASSPAGTLTSA